MGLFGENQSNVGTSTLKYVDIKTIKDGVVVLKNGTLRAVLLVSTVNFDLKSLDEQTAIIGAYQNFLNSLDFPVQIVINSRKLNIQPYIELLKERAREQRNELLKIQIIEYQEFIQSLTEVTNIMSKYFYMVVPFAPVEDANEGILGKISSIVRPADSVSEREELFETYKNQLWQRVDHVAAALGGTGLHFTALNTDELIELYYGMYNPSEFAQSSIKNIDQSEIEGL
jgi:hypothetical protein